MSILDPVKTWIFGIALKKAIMSAAKLIVSYAAAKGIAFAGVIGGISIDLSDVLIMTTAINSALKFLFNMLKTKWPKVWAFLP